VIAQMLFLAQEDPEKDIQLYINSPGRIDHGGHGDLRHHAVRKERRDNDLHWTGGIDGGIAIVGRTGEESGWRCPIRAS
jgi:ATP-dependent protease ClpP protease subunit